MSPTIHRFLFAALLLMSCSTFSNAQTWPANRPEQDPCGAIELCGLSYYSPNAYQGEGTGGAIALGSACTPESNSMWLKVTVIGAGNIVFTITPNNMYDDYDFLVYDGTNATCSTLSSANSLRCNANNNNPGSNINGVVGLNTTSTLITVAGGTFGSSYLQQIAAPVGAVYYILINNFGNYAPNPTGPVSGFNINFAGSTAIFGGSTVPLFQSVTQTCNTVGGISVALNTPVKCSSIAANGSDFELMPGNIPIAGAVGVGCTPAGLVPNLTLTFATGLAPGNYLLRSKIGNDGNTLLNKCDVSQPVGDTIGFIAVSPIQVNAGRDTNICINNSVQLNPTVSGGGGTLGNVFAWTPTAGLSSSTIINPVATPVADVTYTLTVTPFGLTNCAVNDNIQIGVLQGFDIANSDTDICKGSTVILGINGDIRYNFQWTPPTWIADPSQPNTTATPDSTITYTLTATYPGCPDSAQQLTIRVEPLPVVNIGPDRVFCYGDRIFLQPQISPFDYPNYTYQWAPAQYFDRPTDKDPNFTALDNTIISLTVTTQHGCVGIDDANYVVTPQHFVVPSEDVAICPRDTASISATGADSYQWTPARYLTDSVGDAVKAFPPTSTTYTVVGTSPLGCKDTQTVFVRLYPDALISLPDSVTIYPGESYEINAAGNGLYFSWFPSTGLTSANIGNPVATPEVNTRYFVNMQTEYGCKAYDSIDVYVNLESVLDLANAFTPGGTGNRKFMVSRRGIASLKSFTIYNRWGTKVYEGNDIDDGWDGTYKNEIQPMGVYVYRIEAVTNTGKLFKKQGNVTLIR